jgi:hypothetical protein
LTTEWGRGLRSDRAHKPAGDCLASGDHTQDGGDGDDETDGHFAPDSDEFKLDAAAVAAEEAAERKEARREKSVAE